MNHYSVKGWARVLLPHGRYMVVTVVTHAATMGAP